MTKEYVDTMNTLMYIYYFITNTSNKNSQEFPDPIPLTRQTADAIYETKKLIINKINSLDY